MNEYQRAVPNNIEAEQAVLGAILVNNAAYVGVQHFLAAADFYEPLHRKVFEVTADLIRIGKTANPVTIKTFLPADEKVGDMTVSQYLARLASEAVTVINAPDYGKAVYELARRRELIMVGNAIVDAAFDPAASASPWEMATDAEASLRTTVQEWRMGTGELVSLADAVDEAFKAIGDAYQFKKPAGIFTGIEAIDSLTGPWEPGQQIIIGGGTKQGKTALAMQCVMGLAAHGPVWVYSGEMSLKQLAMREIGRRTGIPVWRQKEGRIGQKEFEKMEVTRVEVRKLPVIIEKRRLTLEQLHQRLREIKQTQGLVSAVVDHIGLLHWSPQMAKKDEHELAVIATRELKAIYEDLGIPGVSLSQLKKNTFVDYARKSYGETLKSARLRRPRYTDLMGAVERDADHVLMPFNATPILSALEPLPGTDDYLAWEAALSDCKDRAEIILALSREQWFPQRREVEWHGETTSFGPPMMGRQESLLGGLQ